jgi:putative DNA primase/helicase
MARQDWIEENANKLAMEAPIDDILGVDFHPDTLMDNMDERATNAELAEFFLAACSFRVNKATNELLVYNKREGIYVPKAEELIKTRLERSLPDISKNRKSEIVAKIKDRLALNGVEFDTDKDWLHCNNGWVNILTRDFEEHSSHRPSLHKLPVDYIAEAVCPQVLKFLETTLDPESVGVVIRMIGYCLLKDAKFQRSFMLIGEGSNGKSTLIKLIKAFFGKELVASQSLQDLTNNRFKPAELYGKMVNVFSDLPADKIADAGYFKMLVSGDPISAEKKYGQPFNFENTAKLIFSANQPPKVDGDEGYAFWRRWILVSFNRTFEGDNEDVNLLEKITTPEELSGLLNWAIRGLRLLVSENGFEETDWQEIKKQYALGASNIKDFIKEVCELGEDQRCKTLEFQTAFFNYCNKRGQKHPDPRLIGKELEALNISNERVREKGIRVRYYVGIGLKCPTVPMSQYTPFGNFSKVVEGSEKIIGTTGQSVEVQSQ